MKDLPLLGRLGRLLIGERRDPLSPGIFHKMSLIAFFAWVGLGADGLSSSCYGPAEAFLALGNRPYLGILVGLGTAVTVFLISASYQQIIELFPTGGGGYLVASKLLSPTAGMVCGCALLIDYVLTITISIASGTDALFSFLPPAWQAHKMHVASAVIVLLVALNLRGVKDAVLPLVPIFLLFLVTHVALIVFVLATHHAGFGTLASGLRADVQGASAELGVGGLLILLLRAYAMGAGTYTGIEAVSNGLPILREPRVRTAGRTMRYMAISLAVAVLGLMIGYVLCQVRPQTGKTLNAVLCETAVAGWPASWAATFVRLTLFSEAVLLFVAAQTGFLDGPRVLATMAKDRWVPTRFALLSNRLVVQNGVLLIGTAALAVLALTRGSVHVLVVLYSINVFITFTLSQSGMLRYWWNSRLAWRTRAVKLAINGAGCVLTVLILISLVILKFHAGGWATLAGTVLLIGVVYLIRREYLHTQQRLKRLDPLVETIEASLPRGGTEGPGAATPLVPVASERTAVLLVNGYGGVGLHSLLAVQRLFGQTFRQYVFVCIGVVDAAAFKGVEEIEHLRTNTEAEVERYVRLMRGNGFPAEGIATVGLDVAEEVGRLAPELRRRFPRSIFFGGQLVFEEPSWLSRFLHNVTVFTIQRQLYLQGIEFMLLPIRV